MTDAEIAKVSKGVVLIPATAGKVVLAYNLPDFKGELKLSRAACVGIFLGKIKKWNDPEIAKSNAGAALPDIAIAVVRRAESSGTTFVFTSHLAAISPEWNTGPGAGKSVQFPVGTGEKGNDGVTAAIKQTAGAIGYVEFGFAQQNKLAMASLENKAGKFVAPSIASGTAALATAKLPPDLRAWVTDPEGDGSYPIVTFTWICCFKEYPADKAATLKDLFDYCLGDGQKSSEKLGYLPLPEATIAAARKAVASIAGK